MSLTFSLTNFLDIHELTLLLNPCKLFEVFYLYAFELGYNSGT